MSVSGIINYVQQGFGNHELNNTWSKVCVVALAVFAGIAVVGSCIPVGILCPLTTVAWVVPLTTVLGAIILWRLYSAFNAMHVIKSSFGTSFPSHIEEDAHFQLTKHGLHSHQVRCAMLKSAQSSIVYTASYAGSEALDEMLEIMDERLKAGVHIDLSTSDQKLTKQNIQKIKGLQKTYPRLFNVIIHSEFTSYKPNLFSPSYVKTYHAKGLSIDNGSIVILGGTSSSGSTNPNSYRLFLDDVITPVNKAKLLGFGVFHDVDIVYYKDGSPTQLGQKIDRQLRDLHQLMYKRKGQTLHSKPISHKEHKTPLVHLEKTLKRPQSTSSDKSVDLLITAPEQNHNQFHEALIEAIKAEKKAIYISHMYFHPDKKLSDALVDAANRGVPINVMHNKADKKNAIVHRLFYIQASHCALDKLRKQIQNQDSLKVYEYAKDYTTLHKKVIAFEGQNKVVIGSSNFSYKSLYAKNPDYEINLIAKSPALTDQAINQAHADRNQARLIPPAHKPSTMTRLMGLFQSIFVLQFL